MTTPFEPYTPVNGGMLKQFAGQTVSIMVRLESVAGTNVVANSTDNHKLRISLQREVHAPEGAWVEVIGVPSSGDSIRGKEVSDVNAAMSTKESELILFVLQLIQFHGEKIDFDAESYNTMTHLLRNVKDFYRSG